MAAVVERELEKLTIVIHREDGWYVGYIKEMPEVQTQGETLDEFLDNVKDAIHEVREAKKLLAARKR